MDVFFVLKRPSYTKKPRKIEVLLLLHSGCRGFESLFAHSKEKPASAKSWKIKLSPRETLGLFVSSSDSPEVAKDGSIPFRNLQVRDRQRLPLGA